MPTEVFTEWSPRRPESPFWLRSLEVAEATMAAVTLALLVFFWRRGWLG